MGVIIPGTNNTRAYTNKGIAVPPTRIGTFIDLNLHTPDTNPNDLVVFTNEGYVPVKKIACNGEHSLYNATGKYPEVGKVKLVDGKPVTEIFIKDRFAQEPSSTELEGLTNGIPPIKRGIIGVK